MRNSHTITLLFCATLAACADSDPIGIERRAVPHRQTVAAESFDGTIRIGVVPTATTVTIGSAGAYSIAQKNSGIVLMTGSNSTAAVTLASPSIVKLRLQVMCASPEAVAIRKAEAEALGHITNTEAITSPIVCTRLLLGDFDSSVPFSVRNAYRNLVISQGLAGTDAFYRSYTISAVTYRVTRGTTSLVSSEPFVLTSATGFVTINGVTYRGAAEVIVNSSGTLAGVNVLPVEQYLWGVVPLELGPIAFPEYEAQKAQAVAARTYALANLGRRASDGFDLLATTADQVYGGYAAEHPISTAAVNETAGIVVTYNGALISALYSSAAGGHTASNEEAFNGAPAPYLRGVPDWEHGDAFEHVPSLEVFRSHANPQSLRAVRESDFESNWSRFHRWAFEWNLQEISTVISLYAQQPVGNVLAINVLERGPSGRVLLIEYVTEAGNFTDDKDGIRSSLKFYNASHTLSNLPSTLFFIEPLYDDAQQLRGYRAYGGGFGHGVGVSQTGAVGMAERGHTYDQILTHYYTGVELTSAY